MSKEKIKKYQEEQLALLKEGFEKGYISLYPDSVFDRLRPFSIGGIPLSLFLFLPELCNGYCYDRSMLMQLAFAKCHVVHADIEGLRVQDVEAEHSYVVTNQIEDGPWVLDTSTGLMYKKFWYDKMEKPKVNCIIPKRTCMKNPDILGILTTDYNQDKYALLLTMPIIENTIKNADPNNGYISYAYKPKLKAELAKLKEAIGYDQMIAEEKENMRLMFTDPDALDKKLGIVRDKYGREVSRNGVPNPYYINQDDYVPTERLSDTNISTFKLRPSKQLLQEFKETERKAKLRLKQIKKNPTQNVYEEIK